MDVPGPDPQDQPVGPYTVERYFRLVDDGLLEPDDRVELLGGVVVAMAPTVAVDDLLPVLDD
jgi:hypothetical protein